MELTPFPFSIPNQTQRFSMADILFSKLFSMDGKVPQSLVPSVSSPPAPYPVPLDLPTSVIVCIILLLLFVLLYQFLNGFFHWLLDARHDYDLEGERIHQSYVLSDPSHRAASYQAVVHNDVGTLERFMRKVGEKRAHRLRASEILPPLVFYGSHDIIPSSSDCAICLEDFAFGDQCQVFPSCNHFFHSNCIDDWLRKKLTCPICRNCIVDA